MKWNILNRSGFRDGWCILLVLGVLSLGLVSAGADPTEQSLQQQVSNPPTSSSTLPPFAATPAPTTLPAIVKMPTPAKRSRPPIHSPSRACWAADKQHAIRARTPIDVPPLASAPDSSRPTPPALPVAPLTFVIGPNPANMVKPPAPAQATSLLPPTDPAGDPTLELARTAPAGDAAAAAKDRRSVSQINHPHARGHQHAATPGRPRQRSARPVIRHASQAEAAGKQITRTGSIRRRPATPRIR